MVMFLCHDDVDDDHDPDCYDEDHDGFFFPRRVLIVVIVQAEVRPPCTGLTEHSSLGRAAAGPGPGHTGTGGSVGGRHSCPPV